MSKDIKTEILVIGSGPGGYSAAFRCADLGFDVTLVEKHSTLGGVCLNVGCIPSKALLHVAKVIEESEHISKHGVKFQKPKIDMKKIQNYKANVVKKLTDGLNAMAKMRNVNVIQGEAKFLDKTSVLVKTKDEDIKVEFKNSIIAIGSSPIKLPFIPHDDPRVWDSTDALELKEIPKKLLIMGGGIIGLEMGTVYEKLGSSIDVVEMLDQIIPAADKDIVNAYVKANSKRFNIQTSTKVAKVEAKKDGIHVLLEKKDSSEVKIYDAVLVAIGRSPNGKLIDAQNAGVEIDERGFIKVDNQLRTTNENIFAIGDVVGQPMLAHKAEHEAHTAAEVIAGKKHFFEPKTIPSIAYTFPEVAWSGLTEKEAKEKGIDYEVSIFPWSASGRAIASDVSEGLTKLIFDKNDGILIGGALVGDNAGELLGEITLALEMDCDATDLALTIHAHPTLHESIGLGAQMFEGSITDLPNPKKVKIKNDT